MGKTKQLGTGKSLQHNHDFSDSATEFREVKEAQLRHGIQQVFLQQSVTMLAFKDKTHNNGTVSPDLLEPKTFLGFSTKDLPLLIGAVVGASVLIAAVFLLPLALWKCCRMRLVNKKKEYWLNPKDKANSKKKQSSSTVVQSNSVVFLGLKPTQVYDCHKLVKSEDCCFTKPLSLQVKEELKNSKKRPYSEPLHSIMSAQSPEPPTNLLESVIVKEAKTFLDSCNKELPASVHQSNVTSVLQEQSHNMPRSMKEKELATNDMVIPSVIVQCDSSLQGTPAFFHRTYYSGNFDQHSLYSCGSQMGSEMDLKANSLTWSNYTLRPLSTGDCYYDLFQRASYCKKRKNRMRSDIAAAIALNRSQSTQLNKDTDSLVESEVEVILNERTTL